MAKTMYTYKNVQVPEEAAAHVEKIVNLRAKAGAKCRKADVWLEAVMKVRK